jgi:hypothetical protein
MENELLKKFEQANSFFNRVKIRWIFLLFPDLVTKRDLFWKLYFLLDCFFGIDKQRQNKSKGKLTFKLKIEGRQDRLLCITFIQLAKRTRETQIKVNSVLTFKSNLFRLKYLLRAKKLLILKSLRYLAAN